MTDRTREDELKEVPLWKANKKLWPPGVREIDIEEQDCLGIDRYGNLYWDGRPIEVRYILLTPRQTVWAVIIAVSVLMARSVRLPRDGWRMRTGLVALVCHQSDVHNANSPLCRWQFHRSNLPHRFLRPSPSRSTFRTPEQRKFYETFVAPDFNTPFAWAQGSR